MTFTQRLARLHGIASVVLEHVAKGTWAERYDKSTGQWQWFQWDR